MTTKEKASNLVNTFGKDLSVNVVDEILNLELYDVGDYKDFLDIPSEWYASYWEEVKQEIKTNFKKGSWKDMFNIKDCTGPH